MPGQRYPGGEYDVGAYHQSEGVLHGRGIAETVQVADGNQADKKSRHCTRTEQAHELPLDVVRRTHAR